MGKNKVPWMCPRCGLEGDHLKGPDPKRCTHCCRIDAADDMFHALVAMDALYRAEEDADATMMPPHGCNLHGGMNRARAALAKARGEEG